MQVEEKFCRKCEQVKPITAFSTDPTRRDGYHPYCKQCKAAGLRKHYVEHAEERRARSKAWYEQNIDRAREYRRRYRLEHIEESRAYSREYKRARSATYGRPRIPKTHAEQLAERRKRYAERREHHRALRAARMVRNRDVLVEQWHRKRARRYGLSEHFTAAEWQALRTKYDHRCLACGEQEPTILLVPDHVIPIKQGGTNDISNIQPLCYRCNQVKGSKIIDYR